MQIFTSLALFNILISPLNAFPWVINGLVEAWVSSKRVNAFLQLRELDFNEYYSSSLTSKSSDYKSDASEDVVQSSAEASGIRVINEGVVNDSGSISADVMVPCAVSVRHGSFTWAREDERNSSIPDDQYPAGSGKAAVKERNNDQATSSVIPWSLTRVTVAIKPVRNLHADLRVLNNLLIIVQFMLSTIQHFWSQLNYANLNNIVSVCLHISNSLPQLFFVCMTCFVYLYSPQGQFVGVVGRVGSGKSSLLLAITAEMRKIFGEVGRLSYVLYELITNSDMVYCAFYPG